MRTPFVDELSVSVLVLGVNAFFLFPECIFLTPDSSAHLYCNACAKSSSKSSISSIPQDKRNSSSQIP